MLVLPALANGEFAQTGRFGCVDFDFGNSRGGGRSSFQFAHERFEVALGSLEKNLNPFLPVEDPSRQGVCARQPKHKGPKAYALDYATNFDRAGVHCG